MKRVWNIVWNTWTLYYIDVKWRFYMKKVSHNWTELNKIWTNNVSI